MPHGRLTGARCACPHLAVWPQREQQHDGVHLPRHGRAHARRRAPTLCPTGKNRVLTQKVSRFAVRVFFLLLFVFMGWVGYRCYPRFTVIVCVLQSFFAIDAETDFLTPGSGMGWPRRNVDGKPTSLVDLGYTHAGKALLPPSDFPQFRSTCPSLPLVLECSNMAC